MKLALLSPNYVPPRGWHYHHPRSDVEFRAPLLDDLLTQIHAHETANGWDHSDPDQVQQETLGALVDTHPEMVRVVEPARRRLSQYWSGLQGAAKIAQLEAAGRPVQVSLAHATARAEICEACPFNVPPSASMAQRLTDEVMHRMSGGRQFTQRLRNCAKCSCPLRAKVNLTTEVLKVSGDDPGGYPEFCWVRKELAPPTK